MVCLERPHHFRFFKGCLLQILFGSFLNTLSQMGYLLTFISDIPVFFILPFFFTPAIFDPDSVRSNKTDQLYNDALLMPLLDKLKSFVKGGQLDVRLPDDVALIQSIFSLQLTMFELAKFYGKFDFETNFSSFNSGVGKISF